MYDVWYKKGQGVRGEDGQNKTRKNKRKEMKKTLIGCPGLFLLFSLLLLSS